MTGEVQEINILEMMNGAIGERVSYELAKVIKNCKDLNTDAKKVRGLTIELALTPTESRESMAVKVSVKSKLAPVKALDSTLLLGGTEDDPVVMEYTPQVPGQRTLMGGEQEEPKNDQAGSSKTGITGGKNHVKSSNREDFISFRPAHCGDRWRDLCGQDAVPHPA